MGLNFKKELILGEMQLFPPASSPPPTRLQVTHSRIIVETPVSMPYQERLVSKLGKNAFPFHLDFPVHSPTSVTLQPGLEVRYLYFQFLMSESV